MCRSHRDSSRPGIVYRACSRTIECSTDCTEDGSRALPRLRRRRFFVVVIFIAFLSRPRALQLRTCKHFELTAMAKKVMHSKRCPSRLAFSASGSWRTSSYLKPRQLKAIFSLTAISWLPESLIRCLAPNPGAVRRRRTPPHTISTHPAGGPVA